MDTHLIDRQPLRPELFYDQTDGQYKILLPSGSTRTAVEALDSPISTARFLAVEACRLNTERADENRGIPWPADRPLP